jgi:hypothetical protein
MHEDYTRAMPSSPCLPIKSLLAVLCLALAAPAWAADAPDTPETRRAAAVRYAQVSDFEKMLVAGLETGLEALPREQRAEVMALMKKHLRMDALQELMVAAMVKHFTTAELDALAEFYGSGPGRSAMEKMQPFMTTVMPILQSEIQQTLERIKADLSSQPRGT